MRSFLYEVRIKEDSEQPLRQHTTRTAYAIGRYGLGTLSCGLTVLPSTALEHDGVREIDSGTTAGGVNRRQR